MFKILSLIFIICITAFLIYMFIKMYKKSESFVEQVAYFALLIIYFIPIIIFYLDKFDVPTLLGLANGINTDRWFEFISSYIVGIMGALISGLILVIITFKQISIQIKNNNDDKRIQNAPIFDYALRNPVAETCKYNHEIKLKEDGVPFHVFFKIENIGLNHARNINFLIKVDKEVDRKFSLNGHQSFIRKGEIVWIDLIFPFDANNKNSRSILIEVYYDDLINSSYIQKIAADFTIKSVNQKSTTLDISNFTVEKEMIEKDLKK